MAVALTWTSALGSAPYRDCTGRLDAEGRSYWFEVVTFDDSVDVSLWALSSRGQVRRSRDVKIRRDACKDLRRSIVSAYRDRIEDARAPP